MACYREKITFTFTFESSKNECNKTNAFVERLGIPKRVRGRRLVKLQKMDTR
jgi:hypothetical protein